MLGLGVRYFRKKHSHVFHKKDNLENSLKLTGKDSWVKLFLNEVAGLYAPGLQPAILFKKETPVYKFFKRTLQILSKQYGNYMRGG